mmetsp:Transcript_10952/g.9443  ORF Transcript_10952/g.9443 Transcript_10952/m.9443 type:complete len:85 (-) Transcript_10952:59-313(-)
MPFDLQNYLAMNVNSQPTASELQSGNTDILQKKWNQVTEANLSLDKEGDINLTLTTKAGTQLQYKNLSKMSFAHDTICYMRHCN